MSDHGIDDETRCGGTPDDVQPAPLTPADIEDCVQAMQDAVVRRLRGIVQPMMPDSLPSWRLKVARERLETMIRELETNRQQGGGDGA